MRAARVARLFFLIQPIRSLFSGVIVAVAVVLATAATATTTPQINDFVGLVQ